MATNFGSAEVKLRGGSILVIAHAMLNAGRISDWDTFNERISAEAPDEVLGALVRAGLLRSRPMPSAWMTAQLQRSDYTAHLAQAFGLSSSRSLYAGMKNLSVEWEADRVTFEPTRNRRGGAFEGFETGRNSGHEPVIVAFSVSDTELGLAMREALRRCL